MNQGNRNLPSVISTYWYSLDWDVETIWALDLPVTSFAVSDLAWHLDVPVWPFAGRHYVISPRQVLDDRTKYHVEYARVQAADPGFPIDVTRHRDRWMILDGIHRLARAVERGAQEIAGRVVPDSAVRRL